MSKEHIIRQLIEFLPLNSLECEISRLLKEIFRTTEPDIPDYEVFFKNWVDQFQSVTYDNIEQ